MVAEIIVNSTVKQLNKTFDYIIPKTMENQAKIGTRVFVPFGRIKKQEGFIIDIKEASEFATREIVEIEDSILPEEKIKLAKLMARKYFCNISDCVKLMLPPGNTTKNLANRTKEKMANFVYLKRDIEEIDFDIENKTIKSEKQIRQLNFLKENNGIYIMDLEAITDTTRAITKVLEKNGYIEIIEKPIERNPFVNKKVARDNALQLNEEQQICFNEVNNSIENKEYKEFLLYGITGSGKTEVYLQLIKSVLDKGKTAIMLVPEISLTPQMINRFFARFGDCISVLHSKLMLGERYDQWQKIKERES